MLQAKTIMTKDVVTVRPQDTLDTVIEILVDSNITGIPVVNEDKTLTGIITERDILKYMLEQDTVSRLTDSNLCEHTVYHAMTATLSSGRFVVFRSQIKTANSSASSPEEISSRSSHSMTISIFD
ncbi:MAG: CBS domain-containing protein [Planctomycetota bacterium]|jgi:CBS-domain-containing membrane protein